MSLFNFAKTDSKPKSNEKDPFGEMELEIKETFVKLLHASTTTIFLESSHKNCILENKVHNVEILVSIPKQRIVWNSPNSTDTIPTTQVRLEEMIELVKLKLTQDFEKACDKLLTQRITNVKMLSSTFKDEDAIELATT